MEPTMIIDPLLVHKVLVIAVLVEITTNIIKTFAPTLESRYFTIVAATIGIIIALMTDIGILSSLNLPVRYATFDYILTGVIVSRGGNLVHDLATKLNA